MDKWTFCRGNNSDRIVSVKRRSQWPRGLRRRSAVARLLRSWVRIPPGAWMFVCCEFCVLWGRGLCDELITRLEESYRLWCVVVCDLENLKNEEVMTRVGSQRHEEKKVSVKHNLIYSLIITNWQHVSTLYGHHQAFIVNQLMLKDCVQLWDTINVYSHLL